MHVFLDIPQTDLVNLALIYLESGAIVTEMDPIQLEWSGVGRFSWILVEVYFSRLEIGLFVVVNIRV